jgi:predicted nucleic acid-binding protein
MTALIDTNVLLDVLCNRQEFLASSKEIFDLCELRKIKGYVSSLSIADLMYVMRKEIKAEQIGFILMKLELIFFISSLEAADLNNAQSSDTSDYEDGIQISTAQRIKADCVITRNVKHFERCPLPVLTPEEAVRQVKNSII